jgi:hypothetical protein
MLARIAETPAEAAGARWPAAADGKPPGAVGGRKDRLAPAVDRRGGGEGAAAAIATSPRLCRGRGGRRAHLRRGRFTDTVPIMLPLSATSNSGR